MREASEEASWGLWFVVCGQVVSDRVRMNNMNMYQRFR